VRSALISETMGHHDSEIADDGFIHAYPVDADTHYIWRGRPFTTAAEMGGKRTYSRLISKHANL